VHGLWGFLAVAVLLSLTPGPDDVLVLRSALLGGPRLGAATVGGVAVGTLLWGAAAAVGLASVLSRSSAVYDGVRLAGAGYLVLLGAAPLMTSVPTIARRLGQRSPDSGRVDGGPAPTAVPAFVTGLLSDLLNPKIGVFYLAVVPQFVPPGVPALPYALLLCVVDVAVATVWLLGLTWVAHAAVRWFQRPPVVLWSQRLFSASLIGIGTAAAVGL
jgi:threonine/homoserine/homoserine lactone efflux protein